MIGIFRTTKHRLNRVVRWWVRQPVDTIYKCTGARRERGWLQGREIRIDVGITLRANRGHC
jgi:hypothetical protein